MTQEVRFLIVVTGPTAVGKTKCAISLAKHFRAEIVSADSRQFYKEMSIGTAVPTKAELSAVAHHFIQHKSIADTYDVANYMGEAMQLLDRLFQHSKIVVLTGGSGLFLDAVCNGLDNLPDISPAIRQQVQEIFQTEGLEGLQKRVAQCDAAYYCQADIKNPRRLQRALEIYLATGRPFSEFRKSAKAKRNFECIRIAIQRPRYELIKRIDQRVDFMIQDGLIEEARSLHDRQQLNALNTVGYKELFDYFDGKYSLDEAIQKIKTNTRQYAKRQMTWFRKDKSYQWFHPDQLNEMIASIENSIGSIK